MFGFLNINKPSGMTSHKVISILRKITGIKKIGHAGTLDPLASGVLPVAIGKATSLIDYLPSDKRYTAGLEFGKISDTYDIEGNIEIVNAPFISSDDIKNVLPLFTGKIKQIPPAYSAVHYNGKRLYELARNGKIPDDIPSRLITVYKNDIVEFNKQTQKLKLDIMCSKGTYIRTIVNDLGISLNTGAVMYELIRTEAAGMKLNNSLIIDEKLTKEIIEKSLITPIELLSFPYFEITEDEYRIIQHGNKIKNRFDAQNEILLLYKGDLTAFAICDNNFIYPKKQLKWNRIDYKNKDFTNPLKNLTSKEKIIFL